MIHPPPPSNVGIHMSLIHSQCTIFDNTDLGGVGHRVFITKCPNSFVQDFSLGLAACRSKLYLTLRMDVKSESVFAYAPAFHRTCS